MFPLSFLDVFVTLSKAFFDWAASLTIVDYLILGGLLLIIAALTTLVIVLHRRLTVNPAPASAAVINNPMTDQERRSKATKVITEVRTSYGEKLVDLPYVLENFALFDPNNDDETFVRFVNTYVDLQSKDIASLSLSEVEKTALQLSESWYSAKSRAETLGTRYFGELEPHATRVVNLARVLQHQGNHFERVILVKVIWSQLSILGVPLPRRTARTLNANNLKQLESKPCQVAPTA